MRAAEKLGIITWWRDAQTVATLVGVDAEIDEVFSISSYQRESAARRKTLVAKYKFTVVRPAVRKFESKWFEKHLAQLRCIGGCSYAEIAPLRQPWRHSLHWAPWDRTMWVYFRWWCIARITFAFPLTGFGGGALPTTLENCPLCAASHVNLEHIICRCPGTDWIRFEMASHIDTTNLCSSLQGCAEVEALYHRVRYFGICLSLVKARMGTREAR